MPIISSRIASKDDPIYKEGLVMSFFGGFSESTKNTRQSQEDKKAENLFQSEPIEEKTLDLDIYKRNKFLIKDNSQDVWFSIEEQIDKKYFEIPFAILTAWNPMNKHFSKEANIWLNKKLEIQIKSLQYAYEKSVGACDGHSEESFIVYRIPKNKALELGREFEQYSIFYNDSSSLEYVECASENILLQANVLTNEFAHVEKISEKI